MDPFEDATRANEIARRILAHQNVSEAEYRYIVMFNLAAMTNFSGSWVKGERAAKIALDRSRT